MLKINHPAFILRVVALVSFLMLSNAGVAETCTRTTEYVVESNVCRYDISGAQSRASTICGACGVVSEYTDSGSCMKISCGYTPPPVEPAPWEPTTLSPTAPKSRTVWAEVIGENRVRLSWDTDDLFAIVEGVPEGVVLPKKSVTSWGNNIQVVVAKGSVDFTMSNWPVAEFTAKGCHHKSDCYNQGCADPNYQHKITDVCLRIPAFRNLRRIRLVPSGYLWWEAVGGAEV